MINTISKVYTTYHTTKWIKNPFHSNDEFLKCFSSAKFFNEYIRIVKGSDVKFDHSYAINYVSHKIYLIVQLLYFIIYVI